MWGRGDRPLRRGGRHGSSGPCEGAAGRLSPLCPAAPSRSAGVPVRALVPGRWPPPPGPRVWEEKRYGWRWRPVGVWGCHPGPPPPEESWGAPRAPAEGGVVKSRALRCMAVPEDRNPAKDQAPPARASRGAGLPGAARVGSLLGVGVFEGLPAGRLGECVTCACEKSCPTGNVTRKSREALVPFPPFLPPLRCNSSVTETRLVCVASWRVSPPSLEPVPR